MIADLPPNAPLDYDHTRPRPPGGRFSPSVFIATLGVLAVLMAILTLILPRLETVYKDFGVKLPLITQIVLSAGRSVGPVPAWVVAIPLSVAAAFVAATLPFGGRTLRVLLVLLLAGAVLAVALALFLPMLQLMQNISGGKP